jgi:hypothetical protein
VSASPREATFRVDRGPWLTNPYVGEVPRDGREHEVEVRADRCLPRISKVRFTKNTVLDVALQKVAGAAASIPRKQSEPPPLPPPQLAPLAPLPTLGAVAPPRLPRELDRGDPWR